MGFEGFVGEEGAYVGWDGVVPALRDDNGAGFGCVVVVADVRGWIIDQREGGRDIPIDDVFYPWCLTCKIDIVYSVSDTCAGGAALDYYHRTRKGDARNDGRSPLPIRTNSVDYNACTFHSLLNLMFVRNVNLNKLHRGWDVQLLDECIEL